LAAPAIKPPVLYYWGVKPHGNKSRLYAMRYDFRTARLDSLFLNREDRIATDYRFHLGTTQLHGEEISFGGVILHRTKWQSIRQDSLPK
jgi:hypothetical protein